MSDPHRNQSTENQVALIASAKAVGERLMKARAGILLVFVWLFGAMPRRPVSSLPFKLDYGAIHQSDQPVIRS